MFNDSVFLYNPDSVYDRDEMGSCLIHAGEYLMSNYEEGNNEELEIKKIFGFGNGSYIALKSASRNETWFYKYFDDGISYHLENIDNHSLYRKIEFIYFNEFLGKEDAYKNTKNNTEHFNVRQDRSRVEVKNVDAGHYSIEIEHPKSLRLEIIKSKTGYFNYDVQYIVYDKNEKEKYFIREGREHATLFHIKDEDEEHAVGSVYGIKDDDSNAATYKLYMEGEQLGIVEREPRVKSVFHAKYRPLVITRGVIRTDLKVADGESTIMTGKGWRHGVDITFEGSKFSEIEALLLFLVTDMDGMFTENNY